jgi:hypothetical protein
MIMKLKKRPGPKGAVEPVKKKKTCIMCRLEGKSANAYHTVLPILTG